MIERLLRSFLALSMSSRPSAIVGLLRQLLIIKAVRRFLRDGLTVDEIVQLAPVWTQPFETASHDTPSQREPDAIADRRPGRRTRRRTPS